ncbi:MAG: hypothetical protein WCR69_04195 [Sulfuricurvum sp.]
MLKISKSIKKLSYDDLDDNIFHYKYNVKHLLSLIKKGIDKEDPRYLSSYRSFEGEVFENYIYEKLLRYADENDEITGFVLKGFHQNKNRPNANSLSISEKQQIVYRTKNKEIGEFDAMFTTKSGELYFVEMTLVRSVLKLRKRLRKKKALLDTLFPDYEVKSLIILNDGATGIKQFPSYCTVWQTEEFSALEVLNYILDSSEKKIEPRRKYKSKKSIEASSLKPSSFRYYNTISWLTKKLRSTKKDTISYDFLLSQTVQRYHDLYNKFYIGYARFDAIEPMLKSGLELEGDQRVVVAVEKKHSDEIVVTFYIHISRKKLNLYSFENGSWSLEKKDPYGVTITEVYHINKMMDSSYELSLDDVNLVISKLASLRAS